MPLAEDLRFLSTLSSEHIGEICAGALTLLQEDPPPKMFARAAKQLGLERDVVESGMYAICHVLARAAAVAAPPDRLFDGIDTQQLTEGALQALQDAYSTSSPSLRQACREIAELSANSPNSCIAQ